MTIPLDRLYQYIENIAKEVHGDVVIYHFFPYGSKKLEDLKVLHNIDWYTSMTLPVIICHDQEPLNFEYYENYQCSDFAYAQLLEQYGYDKSTNLKRNTIFDKSILLHSEKQSSEIDRYESLGLIPVYFWSHGFIARDWFRFANYTKQQKQTNKTFLIYNRAWQGTREYRIKFVDFLCEYNLVNHCQTKFNSIDPDSFVHYEDHVFKNYKWQPKNNLSDIFESNTALSNSSADFNLKDYASTDIEVVLETLFDESRIHLTEKSLRPIACEQPFILAGAMGSLNYLREYGFKTFDSVWDESYDQIADPYERLHAIVKLMQEIASWDSDTKNKKLKQAQKIAKFNKKYFFSNNFFNKINLELRTNLEQALIQLESTNTSQVWLTRRKLLAQSSEIKNIITGKSTYPDVEKLSTPMKETYFEKSQIIKVLHVARKYYLRSLTNK